MKEYATASIRNVALVSHGGGGKTSLGEALLNLTGATNRVGKVEEGNTVSKLYIVRVPGEERTADGIKFGDHMHCCFGAQVSQHPFHVSCS